MAKQAQPRKGKKYNPRSTIFSGVKTSWGRRLMIDFGFNGVDPYKDRLRFKYNIEIKSLVIEAESKGEILTKHEFSKSCAEIMFKLEAKYESRDRKESRFDLDQVVSSILSSNVAAYPVQNQNNENYHTWIVAVTAINKLSLREINFLKISFGSQIDYEMGTISSEVLFSELSPEHPLVVSYTTATPIIMIKHIKELLVEANESDVIGEEMQQRINTFAAEKNIDLNVVDSVSVSDEKPLTGDDQTALTKQEEAKKRSVFYLMFMKNKALVSCLLFLLALRVFSLFEIRVSPRLVILLVIVGLLAYCLKKGIFKSRYHAVMDFIKGRRKIKNDVG
ncbi:TPA: hypothetical protein ACSCYS_003367 [Aeromonas veronii]|nr:hypothetical protein [Aeromonas veronii]